jgi:hypothetical protein
MTVLSWRAHCVERIAAHRATLLGRMVNDMIKQSGWTGLGTVKTIECTWTQASQRISR